MIALLGIGDGRTEVHERAWASAQEYLIPALGQDVQKVAVDDADHELGFAGAIEEGWRQIRALPARWVFHLEMDFVFTQPVPVGRMIAVLSAHPYLVQMALKRQPVNQAEQDAGGIVETDPDAYRQRVEHGEVWTEHRKFFTTNPSIYPAVLCHHGWPQVPESEGHFGLSLFEDPDARSAFIGAKYAAPVVEHIGERAGNGY